MSNTSSKGLFLRAKLTGCPVYVLYSFTEFFDQILCLIKQYEFDILNHNGVAHIEGGYTVVVYLNNGYIVLSTFPKEKTVFIDVSIYRQQFRIQELIKDFMISLAKFYEASIIQFIEEDTDISKWDCIPNLETILIEKEGL